METLEALTHFYGNYDEDHRLCSRWGTVEYRTTMRYVERYLRPGMRVLEIGAATGRYSHALARKGYRVDAVELVEHNIEIFKANTQPGEEITVTQGNAMDLSGFSGDTYDVTLLLGPMYHLFTEEDKLRALSEAIRVTKKGGVIFVAYCMADAAIMDYGFGQGEIHNVIKKGMLDPETFETVSKPWDFIELTRKEEIDRLRSQFPVTQLHFLATDGYACRMKAAMDEMDDDTFRLFLRYHFATCERPELVGYSDHTLDIFRKD